MLGPGAAEQGVPLYRLTADSVAEARMMTLLKQPVCVSNLTPFACGGGVTGDVISPRHRIFFSLGRDQGAEDGPRPFSSNFRPNFCSVFAAPLRCLTGR